LPTSAHRVHDEFAARYLRFLAGAVEPHGTMKRIRNKAAAPPAGGTPIAQQPVAAAQSAVAEDKTDAEPQSRRSWLGLLYRGATAIFRVAVSTTGAMIVVLVLWQIARDTFQATFDIKPVTVPDSMEKAGYKPDVVSRKLADELDRIQNVAPTAHRMRSLYFDRPPLDLTMPGLGFSVSSISGYVKASLSLDETILCDITIENDQYVMTIRDRKSSHVQTRTVVRAAKLDELIANAAEQILRLTDPYILAAYVWPSDPRKSVALLRDVVGSGSPEDVAWAYLMLGSITTEGIEKAGIEKTGGDSDGAIRYYKLAVAQYKAIPWYRRWFMSKRALAVAYRDLAIAYRENPAIENPAPWIKYMRTAAGLGLEDAEADLGGSYFEPYGVERDFKSAEMWLKRAAAHGAAEADYFLARLYLNIEPDGSVPPNPLAGMTHLRRAAAGGNAVAAAWLGAEYLYGRYFPADRAEAEYWLSLAAAKGNAEAKHLLELLKQPAGDCGDKC
jgi:TPR repeat protein